MRLNFEGRPIRFAILALALMDLVAAPITVRAAEATPVAPLPAQAACVKADPTGTADDMKKIGDAVMDTTVALKRYPEDTVPRTNCLPPLTRKDRRFLEQVRAKLDRECGEGKNTGLCGDGGRELWLESVEHYSKANEDPQAMQRILGAVFVQLRAEAAARWVAAFRSPETDRDVQEFLVESARFMRNLDEAARHKAVAAGGAAPSVPERLWDFGRISMNSFWSYWYPEDDANPEVALWQTEKRLSELFGRIEERVRKAPDLSDQQKEARITLLSGILNDLSTEKARAYRSFGEVRAGFLAAGAVGVAITIPYAVWALSLEFALFGGGVAGFATDALVIGGTVAAEKSIDLAIRAYADSWHFGTSFFCELDQRIEAGGGKVAKAAWDASVQEALLDSVLSQNTLHPAIAPFSKTIAKTLKSADKIRQSYEELERASKPGPDGRVDQEALKRAREELTRTTVDGVRDSYGTLPSGAAAAPSPEGLTPAE